MSTISIKNYRYDGSSKLSLHDVPTGAPNIINKSALKAKTLENMSAVALLQDRLYAEGKEGLVIALQARDTAGKDSLIKKVFGLLNPAALEVHSFKGPSKEELSHDYLWRINKALPPRGTIGIFNRSHYEDVLVTRVHHMETGYAMPERVTQDSDFYQKRYRQLRNWEQYLYENGYRVIKVYLNISKEEQRKRFLDRLEREDKHWKISVNDMRERQLWKQYDEAFEDAINATATHESPWYVLPADDKWFTRYLMSELLLSVLEDMHPEYPPLDPAEAAKVPALISELESE